MKERITAEHDDYTAAGRLSTRKWARQNADSSQLTTTYSYDQGQMVGTDYSDATQDVAYTYDNFGRPTLVTQAVGVVDGTHNAATQNQHAYIYDPATLVLDKETISYASGLSRSLDRSQDNLLRPSGFQLMNGTAEEHATSYGYDAAGRLSQVASSYPLPATPDFTYNYLTNSGSLLESVTGPAHTVSNTYEATRNVLQQKRNTAGDLSQITNTPISNFVYGVNALGQRDDVARTGSAFATANTETWNYNAKGEVVSASHSTTNAFDRSFEFDGIGNRKKSVDGLDLTDPSATSYTANALNQYGNIDANTRTFDDDGNLTDDGDKLYVWDAENRLIEIKLKSDDSTVATYGYDFRSRRITKTVGFTETNFVYDGWNPIAEFSGTTISRSYVWGRDMSIMMQGAGGVGGLLSVKDGNDTYYPTYDGNGNVSEYVDAGGFVVAHYEYDAWGQVMSSAGDKKGDFIHQFSTKPLDSESGLHYYGYRYYDSANGRWLGRDPLKEKGGVNLYGFLTNDGLNKVDRLGLDSTDLYTIDPEDGSKIWNSSHPDFKDEMVEEYDTVRIVLDEEDTIGSIVPDLEPEPIADHEWRASYTCNVSGAAGSSGMSGGRMWYNQKYSCLKNEDLDGQAPFSLQIQLALEVIGEDCGGKIWNDPVNAEIKQLREKYNSTYGVDMLSFFNLSNFEPKSPNSEVIWKDLTGVVSHRP